MQCVFFLGGGGSSATSSANANAAAHSGGVSPIFVPSGILN